MFNPHRQHHPTRPERGRSGFRSLHPEPQITRPLNSCVLYPRKRTCAVQLRMSALGQKRTWPGPLGNPRGNARRYVRDRRTRVSAVPRAGGQALPQRNDRRSYPPYFGAIQNRKASEISTTVPTPPSQSAANHNRRCASGRGFRLGGINDTRFQVVPCHETPNRPTRYNRGSVG